MFVVTFLRKLLKLEKEKRGGEPIQKVPLDISYEFIEDRKTLNIYISMDASIDETVVIPLNEHELLVVSQFYGPIGVLKIKKPYMMDSIKVERKARTKKIVLTLK